MESSRQEYWSELPFPSPGDLSNPGIKLRYPVSQTDSLLSEQPRKPLVWDNTAQHPHVSELVVRIKIPALDTFG